MPFFSIVLLTYNRPAWMRNALSSILDQTFPDFELLVIDNGSTDPEVAQYLATIADSRVKVIRHAQNLDTNYVLESALARVSGNYVFPFFADDDLMCPLTLETVADVFRTDQAIDFLSLGLVRIDYLRMQFDQADLNSLDGSLRLLDGRFEFRRFCYAWGIGTLPKEPWQAWRAHSSALVLSKRVVDETRSKQQRIYLPPFGDVGFIGALLNATKPAHLSLPLIAIGVHPVSEMAQSRLRNRRLCDRHQHTLDYCPIKAATFFSLGAESHLKAIHLNGLASQEEWPLRPRFFLAHLSYLLCDRRLDRRTWQDVRETLPLAIASVGRFWLHTVRRAPFVMGKIWHAVFASLRQRRASITFPDARSLLNHFAQEVRSRQSLNDA